MVLALVLGGGVAGAEVGGEGAGLEVGGGVGDEDRPQGAGAVLLGGAEIPEGGGEDEGEEVGVEVAGLLAFAGGLGVGGERDAVGVRHCGASLVERSPGRRALRPGGLSTLFARCRRAMGRSGGELRPKALAGLGLERDRSLQRECQVALDNKQLAPERVSGGR